MNEKNTKILKNTTAKLNESKNFQSIQHYWNVLFQQTLKQLFS